MPEGDTVHLAASRLAGALEGRVLTRTDFRVPSLATADLSGRKVEEVVARGKHLLFRMEGGVSVHSHLAMEGEWHLYRPGERWRGRAFEVRVVLENAERVAVGWRLPVLEIVATEREHEIVGHLGPDVLGPDWDPDEALRRMEKHPERAIGEVLLDQEVMAGPGNIYRSELCFLRGIHPATPVARIDDLAGLIALTKRTMEANRSTGRQITTGDLRPGREHWVYGRAGRPCRRCGTTIEMEMQRGSNRNRAVYWCPRCQPRGPHRSS